MLWVLVVQLGDIYHNHREGDINGGNPCSAKDNDSIATGVILILAKTMEMARIIGCRQILYSTPVRIALAMSEFVVE